MRLAWRLEAAWWMTRLHILNYSLLIAAAAWFAADGDPPPSSLAGLLVFIAGIHGAIMTVNDLLDEDDDRVTAPYLPLPSGIMTRPLAYVSLACLIGLAAGGLVLASQGDGGEIAVTLAMVVVALGSTALYSLLKWAGALGSLFATFPLVLAPLVAWTVADGGESWRLVAIVAYAFLRGFSLNIVAALRDLDTDPEVGNRTLPVRIGAGRAFRVMAALDLVAAAIVLALAVGVPDGWRALPVLVPSVAWMVVRTPTGVRSHERADRGRLQRVRDIWIYAHGRVWCDAALVCVFSLPTGLALGAALWLVRELGERAYRARVVEGGLARRLRAPAAPRDLAPG